MQNAIPYSLSAAVVSLALLASTSFAIADTTNEPVAIGRPHACNDYYPAEALKKQFQGNTVLAFTIGEDGIPRDVSVATSSGDKDLDDAAITCSKTWVYRPAMRNGKPIATPWKANVAWSIQQAPTAPPPTPPAATQSKTAATHPVSIGRPHTCSNYPESAIENMASGTTTLQFTIDAQGWTSDISVRDTSGNKDLDQAAIDCASRWHYKPAMQDGVPIAVPWIVNVAWTMPQLSLPVGYNPGGHQCAQAFRVAEIHHDGAFDLRLAFFINADGSVDKPRVVHSSQDFELDSAFVSCVTTWEYTPARRHKTPVRIVWGTLFHMAPQTGAATREGPSHLHYCQSAEYAQLIAANGNDATTVLKFQINKWGRPDQIEIAESSGNADLDDAAKTCAAQWTYDSGSAQTAPLPWSVQIGWKATVLSIAAELGNGDDPTGGEPTPPPAPAKGGI